MPLFEVTEVRKFEEITLIDAVDQEAAQQFHGEILEQYQTDSWGDELVTVVERDDA